MTARSSSYLKARLKPSQPDVINATAVLAQNGIDIIDSLIGSLVTATNYNFPAEFPKVVSGSSINPSRQLFAGVPATVRFDTVPAGVNGADAFHYLYINDGANSEAVLITGGTASSTIRDNATITFTPANNHTGNLWSITAATSGIQEASIANPSYSVSVVGPTICYAPVYLLSTTPGLVGGNPVNDYLNIQFSNDSIIKLFPTATLAIKNLGIYPLNGSMSTGSAIIPVNVGGGITTIACRIYMDNVIIGGNSGESYIGVKPYVSGAASGTLYASNCYFASRFRGIDADTTFVMLHNNQVVNDRDPTNFLANSSALYLRNTAGGFITDWFTDGGMFDFGWIVDAGSSGHVNEMSCKGIYIDRFSRACIYIAPGGDAASWELSNFRFADINGSTGTLVAATVMALQGAFNWQISNGNIALSYGTGISIVDSPGITITGVSISPNKAGGGIAAIVVGATAGGVHATKNLVITGCAIGSDTELAGTPAQFGFVNACVGLTDLTLVGNDIEASTQAKKIVLLGNEVAPLIADNNGINNIAKSVVAAAALAFPVLDQQDTLTVTGNTNVTSVTGLHEGQVGIIVCTGTPTWTQGNNIASPNLVAVANTPYKFTFTNSLFYIG